MQNTIIKDLLPAQRPWKRQSRFVVGTTNQLFKITSFSSPIQDCEESSHHLAASSEYRIKKTLRIMDPKLFYKTQADRNTLFDRSARNVESLDGIYSRKNDSRDKKQLPASSTPCSVDAYPARVKSYHLFLVTHDKLGPTESCQSTWHALLCSKCPILAGQPV